VVGVTFEADLRAAYGAGVDAWADDASILYGPLAEALAAQVPVSLAGRLVLDAGAGTGVAARPLAEAGARVVAVDLTHAMLRRDRAHRPPSTAGDVLGLPFRDGTFDVSVAAFVLNHVHDPAAALAELRRVSIAGGWIVANAFSVRDRLAVKDAIDECVIRRGWSAPGWYRSLQDQTMPLVGSADAMHASAVAAGLTAVRAEEHDVPIGIVEPGQLARYRLGMPQFGPFLKSLDSAERQAVFREALEAVRTVSPDGAAVAPAVVSLVARVPE
jgi:ubiquinone/menaquinone biosynthesis C-methylase UbiE